MKFRKKLISISFFTTLVATLLSGQCTTWLDSPQKDYLEGQHSVYRGLVKTNNFTEALAPWKEVYEAAPAADGRRDFHYTDGIKIYRSFFDNETDEAKKKEYIDHILRLYDEAIACYDAKVIQMSCNTDECYDKQISSLYARKAYDMYYYFRIPYSQTAQTLQNAIDRGKVNTQYTVVVPYADIAVYQFTNENISKEEARRIHDVLLDLCEQNISNGNQYAAYYQQARDAMKGKFREIEDYIFDCDYFKELLRPDYDANSDDPQLARELYNQLRQRGCTEEDPFLAQLAGQWEQYAAEENARRQAEFEASNPGFMARKAYEAGDFIGAMEKYREAIEKSEEDAEKAEYHLAVASILFRQLDKSGDARSEARTAASLNPSWGRPYVLIGDIYAKAARNCGDSWNQRLAVLAAYDKWAYAKSQELDEQILDDVNTKMSRYRSSFPTKDEGFMRGVKPGSRAQVGCWIGETVQVRYQ
jgi:hypothetical protein